ncbi:PaaI family thioesterase [Phascolarctobacterium succinatutens]|uniref:PaaI family thioesterase n=1 Tax=Phascolarctobacterium succinatutens TaxID=626940 RepID=UPI00307FEDB0
MASLTENYFTLRNIFHHVTGASVGAVVATLNFSMNFIKGVHEPTTLTVRSHIKHSGHSTMVIEAEMTDSKKNLIGTILTTMFVVDRFKEIPAKW